MTAHTWLLGLFLANPQESQLVHTLSSLNTQNLFRHLALVGQSESDAQGCPMLAASNGSRDELEQLGAEDWSRTLHEGAIMGFLLYTGV